MLRPLVTIVLGVALTLLAGTGLAASPDPGCRYCGMHPARPDRSWMEIHGIGEDPVGVCSLHCAAIHLALNPGETPSRILVRDYPRGHWIDADRAHWVLGGDVPGVMTHRAKWAFQTRAEADRFRREHGGSAVSFDEALQAAFEDMRADTLHIQQRRRKASGGPPRPAGDPP
jgi:nitrous oxide reductase accessory protein NosL